MNDKPLLLLVQVQFTIGQRKDSQLAVGPVGSHGDDVGNENVQAPVVVQPPNVHSAVGLLLLEDIHRGQGLLRHRRTIHSSVDDVALREHLVQLLVTVLLLLLLCLVLQS